LSVPPNKQQGYIALELLPFFLWTVLLLHQKCFDRLRTMANLSLAFLASSVWVTLAVFLVGETSSFHLLVPTEGKRANTNANTNLPSEEEQPRRAFLTDLLSKGAAVGVGGVVSSVSLPLCARAAPDLVSTGKIKVTAIAHTFVTTGKSPSPNPIRENDATRFFTNARVMYLFVGSNDDDNSLKLAQEVTDLTKQRKAEKGPGVTPGNIQTLDINQESESPSAIIARVVKAANQMPEGDVLVVGPIRSTGTGGDGRLLMDTASGLGTFVGGKKEQGVVSVLLNGPKENLKLIESGFPASELLWYSLPPKKQ
jgi:hypothetical protein